MINDSGQGYWSTGIHVCWHPGSSVRDGVRHDGWSARLEFFDDGFCSDDTDSGRISTEGELRTQYAVVDGATVTGLRAAIDTLIADARRMGIKFRDVGDGGPTLYYRGDGGDPGGPPPAGWRRMLADEAERIGWVSYERVPQ